MTTRIMDPIQDQGTETKVEKKKKVSVGGMCARSGERENPRRG